LDRSAHPAWTEIRVLAPEGWLELVADALALSPCTSVAFGRPSLACEPPPAGFDYVRTFVIEGQDTPELRADITRKLAQLAVLTGAGELSGLRPRFSRLPPEDYANSWKKSWKPFRVAGFALVPRDFTGKLRASDRRLIMEPGGAFGTGRHPTTRGCLRVIAARVRGGERILDAGCGNGVLAVASALCGARKSLGFDLDPSALPYAESLAADNAVAGRCEWRVGGFDCLAAGDTEFDGVCANLFADLIQAHARDLARRLKAGGWFAISGCRADYRVATLRALAEAGLLLQERSTRGRWDTYAGIKPEPGPASP
jgi:ribosomal protein L11 methyltransferase